MVLLLYILSVYFKFYDKEDVNTMYKIDKSENMITITNCINNQSMVIEKAHATILTSDQIATLILEMLHAEGTQPFLPATLIDIDLSEMHFTKYMYIDANISLKSKTQPTTIFFSKLFEIFRIASIQNRRFTGRAVIKFSSSKLTLSSISPVLETLKKYIEKNSISEEEPIILFELSLSNLNAINDNCFIACFLEYE